MTPMLGIMASSISGSKAVTSSYESIATTTVGSGGQSTVTFSSIPSTYKHLQVRGIARNSSSTANDIEGFLVQYNSDTGANYSRHSLLGNGSSASAGSAVSDVKMYSGYSPTNGSTSNVFNGFVIDILDYANTSKYKTQRVLIGDETNNSANSNVGLWSGLWQNTAAINSITFYSTGSANFVQYSSFALYGIKG
jgi:hypothetical protein